MRTPRNISSKELVKLLKVYGYEIVRQNGSHITVTTERNGQNHLAIPNHNPIKTGTLNGIISRGALHYKIEKREVFNKLF